jgi:glycosyltransferase involved in cell wall biosynthesis
MLIADTAAAFAEAMMRLEADDALWATLSDGGRELVSETLGLGACEAALERILGSLLIRRAA